MTGKSRDRYSREAHWVMLAAFIGLGLIAVGHKNLPLPVERAPEVQQPLVLVAAPVAKKAEAPVVAQKASPALRIDTNLPTPMVDMVVAISRNSKFRKLDGVKMKALKDRVEIVIQSEARFSADSADLSDQGKEDFAYIAKLLKGGDPVFNIVVVGAQAEKVVDVFKTAGLEANRLRGVGLGDSQAAVRDPSNVAQSAPDERDKRIVLRLEPSQH